MKFIIRVVDTVNIQLYAVNNYKMCFAEVFTQSKTHMLARIC